MNEPSRRILYQLTSPMHRTMGQQEIDRRQAFLQSVAAPGFTVEARPLDHGPGSIESEYDAAMVVPEVVRRLSDAPQEGYGAAIIGCFSDPGIAAAREVTRMPVIGPGESAMHLAAQLGHRFAVLSPLDGGGRVTGRLRQLGLDSKFAGAHGIGISVLALAEEPEKTLDLMAEGGKRIAEENDADVIVLGCMSMAFMDVTEDLQERIGLPVVNPVTAAVKTAEAFIGMGLTHSKAAYPPPPPKQMY